MLSVKGKTVMIHLRILEAGWNPNGNAFIPLTLNATQGYIQHWMAYSLQLKNNQIDVGFFSHEIRSNHLSRESHSCTSRLLHKVDSCFYFSFLPSAFCQFGVRDHKTFMVNKILTFRFVKRLTLIQTSCLTFPNLRHPNGEHPQHCRFSVKDSSFLCLITSRNDSW